MAFTYPRFIAGILAINASHPVQLKRITEMLENDASDGTQRQMLESQKAYDT